MTQAAHNVFHSIDRELYATLVFDLWRDPVEAIQMMAIWMWLERMIMGCPELTRMILSLNPQVIEKIGDEALLYWACIDNTRLRFSCTVGDFLLTNMLLKQDMPINFVRKHREVSVVGINEVIKNVCAKYFKDIWDSVIARNAQMDFIESVAKHEPMVRPHELQTHPDDRTLFITFSRGYPVAEWEVRQFFNEQFGDCIESFYMQEVAIGEHALFAKIVLYQASYMQAVLSGGRKVKFTINSKHVWMRKYIPKRR
ncbi:hypothetical protein Tco_0845271 [Tanacetum coccineum]